MAKAIVSNAGLMPGRSHKMPPMTMPAQSGIIAPSGPLIGPKSRTVAPSPGNMVRRNKRGARMMGDGVMDQAKSRMLAALSNKGTK